LDLQLDPYRQGYSDGYDILRGIVQREEVTFDLAESLRLTQGRERGRTALCQIKNFLCVLSVSAVRMLF